MGRFVEYAVESVADLATGAAAVAKRRAEDATKFDAVVTEFGGQRRGVELSQRGPISVELMVARFDTNVDMAAFLAAAGQC